MAVEVYFWAPSGTNIGHAAIKADGGTPIGNSYLSAWPGSPVAVIFGPAAFNAFEDDVRAEGGHPLTVRLTQLNETKIKAQMEECRKFAMYGFLNFNCATQAGICLNAGVPGSEIMALLDLLKQPYGYIFSTSVIYSPLGLYAYAKLLSVKYE